MFEKIKNFFKKKPKEEKVIEETKEEIKFNNMEDVQTVIGVQKEFITESKSETKSSLTFGK